MSEEPEVVKKGHKRRPPVQIPNKFIRLRIENGLSQAAMAEKIDEYQSTVSAWETGRARISPRKWYKVLEAFGKEYEPLFDEPATIATPVDLSKEQDIAALRAELEKTKQTLEALQLALKHGFGDEFVAPAGDLSTGPSRFKARASMKSHPPYAVLIENIEKALPSREAWAATIKEARDTDHVYLHGPSAAYAFYKAWVASANAAARAHSVEKLELDSKVRKLKAELADATELIEKAGL